MKILFLAVFVALSAVQSIAGGLIVVTDWPGRAPRLPGPHGVALPRLHFPLAPLEVASEAIQARVKDQVATVAIEQEFYNPNAQQLEGTFLFPLPKGAQLDKFKMEIGGKMMEPELLSADMARRIYEEIVRKAKDPALLEYEGRDLLKVRIFPIEPHSRKKIALSYTQVLKLDSGLVNFVIPVSSQKYSAKPVERLTLDLQLETATPLKTVYSPTHSVDVARPNARQAGIKLDARQLAGDNDFQLLYGFEKSEVALKMLTHRRPDGDGYFMLFASPGVDARETEVAAKDVAFVLDTSGSMSGPKIEQARKALLFCVRNLNEQDRFEVIRFSTETESLFRGLRPASRENLQKAESFIEGLKALNGTAIDEALRHALELRSADSSRPFVVIFLTDGLPTVGETRQEKIVANVCDRAGSTRVFCFGIGTDVNTHLLDQIAEKTRAFSQYIVPGEDIEVKVSSFFSKIRDPLLAGVKLDLAGDIRLSRMYPTVLPDIFKGEQIIVAGRYQGAGRAQLKLHGTVNGADKTFAEKFEFPERNSEHEFIPRLWATRRVGALLDQIRLNGENAELRDEVTDLARQYGIVTPYTAYLIMEDEVRRGVPAPAQTLPAAAAAPAVRQKAQDDYRRFRLEKSGAAAVSAAQDSQALRMAETPEPNRNSLAMTPLPRESAPATVQAARMAAPQKVAQASRFIAGRAFYQNGAQWVDTQVQKQKDGRRLRIQFNSEAYFAFAARNRALAPILSLGANLQFVHEGQVIEIHE